VKRDIRLQGLSSDHHHALVFARKLEQRVAANSVDASLILDMAARFEDMLLPHFRVEEELLVPALVALGEDSLVQRILDEHRRLQDAVVAANGGDYSVVGEFASLLTEHVRFEEREVFPVCEERLPAEVLDGVGRRATKP
jgi:hemerythrin-like domain-containing protein